MNVTEEDAVGSFPSPSSVVKRECYDVLHVLRVLKRFDGRVQVVFIGQVDALEYSALRVEKVAIIVTAAAAVLSQHAMSAGTGALVVAAVKAELLTATIVVFAHICSWKETHNLRGGGCSCFLWIRTPRKSEMVDRQLCLLLFSYQNFEEQNSKETQSPKIYF